jgi:alpha-amylase
MTNFKKWSILTMLVAMMALASCGNGDESSDISSGPTSIVPEDQYEDTMTWSQPNHVYIHYRRINDDPSEYNDWTVWAWQKAPNDLGGIEIEWSRYDQSGMIAELDFSSATPENQGHLYLEGQSMVDITRLGFLIVYKPSMPEGIPGMWTSDGGADMYINDFNTHIRQDGSIHIFAVQGMVSEYTFTYTDVEIVDPYANDSGGDFVSVNNINSSGTPLAKARTSPDFYNNVGVGYQIFVRSFADSDGDGHGDIRGIINKLEYLDNLGVKALWLTPINTSEKYHGYDVSDFYGINPSLGSVVDYAELIYKAHQRDMRIIMDLVVNHTSDQNPWFQNSVNMRKGTNTKGEEIDYRNFYHWRYDPTNQLQAPWHKFGTTDYYYYGKFATSMPELNYDYQGTRDAMIDVAKYWLGFGVDGFRIDAVKHMYMKDEVDVVTGDDGDDVVDDYDDRTQTDYSSNQTKNLHFFKEFNYRIKSVYPNAFIVGENFDGWDARIAPYYQGMDSLLDFQNYYHLVNMMHGIESGSPQAESVVYNVKYNQIFPAHRQQFINGAFTSNHDVARVVNHVMGSKSGSEVNPRQTLTTGDYAEALNKAFVYNATTLMQPGLSWIYYGDELGMTSNWQLNPATPEFPEGNDFHVDRWFRQPMKWANSSTDYDTNYTFEGYTVEHDAVNSTDTVQGAAEQQNNSNSMFSMMKKIADFKHTNSAMINGTYTSLWTNNPNVFAYRMQSSQGTFYIYVNFGSNTVSNFNQGGSSVQINWNNANASNLPGYSWVVLS